MSHEDLDVTWRSETSLPDVSVSRTVWILDLEQDEEASYNGG